jgi:hypothetical protein
VAALATATRREEVEAEYGTWFRMAPLLVTATIYAGALIIGRRALLSNRINRQLMALFGVGIFGAIVHRAFSVLLHVSAHGALTMDAILFSTLAAFAVFTVHRGFLWTSGIFLAAAVVCLLWPSAAVGVFGIAAALAIAATSFAIGGSRRGR